LRDRAAIVVACGRSARVSEVARQFDVPSWTRSYADAVSRPDVDVVVNLTPFPLHEPITLAALEAGKHVYSEKPLAQSVRGAESIRKLAAERGLVVAAAPSVMVFPQVLRVATILESRELGPITSVRGQGFGGVPPWEGYLSDPSPFFVAETGPLVDMAVYPLHAITGLLGPVREVTALASRTRNSFEIEAGPFADTAVPVECDDDWHLVLRLASGPLVSIEANMCVAGTLSPEVEIRGEQGVVAFDLLDGAKPVRVLAGGDVREELVADERGGGPDHLLGIAHLLDCLEGSAEPRLTVDHALHVIAVIEAARTSVRERRVVHVDAPAMVDQGVADG